MSTMRLYGSTIAIVSGGYSVYLSTTGMTMDAPAWFMFGLGIIVILHGLLLLTPPAAWLGAGSGIAMVVYSVLMLGNQGWLRAMEAPPPMMGVMTTGNMSWNPGMIAIAVLMLVSGLIMTIRRQMM